MGKSSIHIQKASGGAITHNSRENYSKSVVFTDEKNELWNNKKEAYEIYRSEINKRIEAYTNRTNQKLQKTAVTQLSAVINLEQHHTLKDLEKIKDELEKVFDTKVYQMAIHRDEGKLKHKSTNEYLVSGTDFYYNPNDDKYYTKKRVENKKHIFENELNINDYEIEKNYHAHIEMLGLDSQGQAIRQKMNRFVLSQLQDFTAQTLQMERGNLFTNSKSNKRLDTHEFKAEKKRENEVKKVVKKVVKKEKEKIIVKANEIIKDERTQKKILKAELEKLKEEKELLRKELQNIKSERTVYAELEALNQKLKSDLGTGRKNFDLVKQELETFKDKYLKVKNELNFVECKAIDLKEELEEIKLDVYSHEYKNQNNEPVKNIDVVKHLQKKVNTLQNENKSLISDKRDLEHKVITLEEKINSRANMSDYESIKKENEELKKENASLKSKIKNIISQANEKIKELFRFKIFNDVKFGYDRLYEEDWEKECDNDVRLEKKYQRELQSELIEEQEKTNREIFESLLEEGKKDFNLDLSSLDKLNENMRQFIGEEKEEENHHQRDIFQYR